MTIDDELELGALCNLNAGGNEIYDVLTLTTEEANITSSARIGTGATSYQLPTANINVPGSTIFDNLGAGGLVFKPPAYSETYFIDNASPTSQTPTDTYIAVAGTRTTGLNTLFSPGGTLITYNGTYTRNFKVSCNVSWLAGGTSPEVYRLAIFKNGSVITSSQIGALLDDATNTWPRNATSECLVSLATNDTLEARVKNTESTQTVLVRDLNLNIIEL